MVEGRSGLRAVDANRRADEPEEVPPCHVTVDRSNGPAVSSSRAPSPWCSRRRRRGDLVGTAVDIGPEQHPDQGVVTLRVYLVFDNELDQLLAVNGDGDVSPLRFETDGEPLRQNCIGQAAAGEPCDCDCPTQATSAATPGSTSARRCPRSARCPWSRANRRDAASSEAPGAEDNGGYFDGDPGSQELPDENGRILIAQFSLPDDTSFSYRGTASFNLGGGDLTSRAFLVEHTVCRGDLDVSGAVDFDDVLLVLTNWGPQEPCPPHRPADLDKDCDVGFGDLLMVLSAWGPCQ